MDSYSVYKGSYGGALGPLPAIEPIISGTREPKSRGPQFRDMAAFQTRKPGVTMSATREYKNRLIADKNIEKVRWQAIGALVGGAVVGYGIGLGASSISRQYGGAWGFVTALGGGLAAGKIIDEIVEERGAPKEIRWGAQAGLKLGISLATYQYRKVWQEKIDAALKPVYEAGRKIQNLVHRTAPIARGLSQVAETAYKVATAPYYLGQYAAEAAFQAGDLLANPADITLPTLPGQPSLPYDIYFNNNFAYGTNNTL
jgi:hypothetical protein